MSDITKPANQFNLGHKYEMGLQVPQDYILAQMWYNLAAASGYYLAPGFRAFMEEKMSQADISKAQSMARECLKSGYIKCGD